MSNVKSLNRIQVFILQILFGVSIYIGSQGTGLDKVSELAVTVARYVAYIYVIRGSGEAIRLTHNAFRCGDSDGLTRLYKKNHAHYLVFAASVGYVLLSHASILGDEFLYLYVGSLIVKYIDMEKQKRAVSYGTGMACSFYEGYLAHMIPSDGHKFVGFEENIRMYESNESIKFPVIRLFIIITKDLYCPPDLKAFNKPNRPDLPYLEACKPLEKVKKDVAGVKKRVYRNSAYKVVRRAAPPLYVAAECATPLHTLHLVLSKKALYTELEDIDKDEVVNDFCTMLTSILTTNPDCKGKCECIYFDNTDPEANLAQVLIDRIREIEPNFEEIVRSKDCD
ncbi:unnamed protein product [Diatraea saccharalis]|uniref:STING ligand-binding domain-containing protein n=1 Tax=Diatraea saccharalis TaxID=40085 RepID=A0A9N9R269_9NEOP|nr:unnamed protein product [Diatraea saccharalis]